MSARPALAIGDSGTIPRRDGAAHEFKNAGMAEATYLKILNRRECNTDIHHGTVGGLGVSPETYEGLPPSSPR